MSKKRRKANSCFNCSTHLRAKENYCPNCGQENHNKQASTRVLINDFLQDYIGFDNKLMHSLKPLVLHPGEMTKKFLEGKRRQYIPPIRMFLFLSFLYFGAALILFPDAETSITINGNMPNSELANEFTDAYRRNLNLMMFFFMPIQALLIMLVYRSKERKYYVNFFVYTVHLYSFLFLIGTFFELLDWLLPSEEGVFSVTDYLIIGIQLLALGYFIYYCIVSLKRVFSKKRNILRFIILLLLSITVFAIVVIGFILLLGWIYGML
jgi:predicted RNA-binding Zn-ribbon protein involved in translation (DUF1610 family)